MAAGHCKQCYFYEECKGYMPQEHPLGIWQTIEEKRRWMRSHGMDCFKSEKQYRLDIESAKKSKNGGTKNEKV